MEKMEHPKKRAGAPIAGLPGGAGMAAPAMADETAADPTVGQTQSADPTKDALDKAHKVVTPSKDTTITVDTPDSANSANRAAVKTSTQAKLGDTGVDVMETAVFTIMAAGTAGATRRLKTAVTVLWHATPSRFLP